MRSDEDFHFPGQSGSYSAGPLATLQREPGWAVFANGIPVPWVVEGQSGAAYGTRGEDD